MPRSKKRSQRRNSIGKTRKSSSLGEPPDRKPPILPAKRSQTRSASDKGVRRTNYFNAFRRVRNRVLKLSPLAAALYFNLYDLSDRDREIFSRCKSYLSADINEFCNDQLTDPDEWLARCIFQNEQADVTLQQFVQMYYKKLHHPTGVRMLASEWRVNEKIDNK